MASVWGHKFCPLARYDDLLSNGNSFCAGTCPVLWYVCSLFSPIFTLRLLEYIHRFSIQITMKFLLQNNRVLSYLCFLSHWALFFFPICCFWFFFNCKNFHIFLCSYGLYKVNYFFFFTRTLECLIFKLKKRKKKTFPSYWCWFSSSHLFYPSGNRQNHNHEKRAGKTDAFEIYTLGQVAVHTVCFSPSY